MSKFDKLFEAREESVKEKPTSTGKNAGAKMHPAKAKKETTITEISEPNSDSVISQSSAAPVAANKQRGRPKAKRSNPDFIGFTTYIRKDTHLKVKILLLQEGDGREMSELVEELLSGWAKNK